jgi:Bacterial archaeo-eukaryotic release factor family 3
MNSCANNNLAGLLDAHEPPCLSLYQPTHRHHPDNQQDPIRPDALPIDALRDRGWRAVEPQYLARLAGLVEAFGEARSQGRGADELAQVAEAAMAGRVATLLIEADRQVPGRMDAATGRIALDDLAHPEVDDLLDNLGELVLKLGGQIVVVPAERMPTPTGLAAIYRF